MEYTDIQRYQDEARIEIATEKPIKIQRWSEAPIGNAETSIRERIREFFASGEIPDEYKPFGFLGQEVFVQTAKEL